MWLVSSSCLHRFFWQWVLQVLSTVFPCTGLSPTHPIQASWGVRWNLVLVPSGQSSSQRACRAEGVDLGPEDTRLDADAEAPPAALLCCTTVCGGSGDWEAALFFGVTWLCCAATGGCWGTSAGSFAQSRISFSCTAPMFTSWNTARKSAKDHLARMSCVKPSRALDR